MPQLINWDNELIRINPQKNTIIEYSNNRGSSWITRYSGTNNGSFIDLCILGKEIIACTTKGVFYSTNKGSSWISRYTSTNNGDFKQIIVNGDQLLATTSKGLFYSTNRGSSWIKKG